MTTATTMRRSTRDILYVSPSDFELAENGTKSATSREGKRQEMWPVGSRVQLVNNEDDSQRLLAEITYNVPTKLADITKAQAGNIGGYGVQEHYEDFLDVYPNSTDETELSLIGFRVIEQAQRQRA